MFSWPLGSSSYYIFLKEEAEMLMFGQTISMWTSHQVQALVSTKGTRRRLRRQVPPRGATPRPRSGAEAGRTPCPKGSGQEELPHVRGQRQRPRVPGCDSAGMAQRSYPSSRSGRRLRGATPRRRSGRQPRGATPCPRSHGCAGTRGPRGAIPC